MAAWNTLCALVDCSLRSKDARVRDILWTANVWPRAFDLYLGQGHLARPKSARQLLATLTAALIADTRSGNDGSLGNEIAQRPVQVLVASDDQERAKTCALAIGHFLTKDVLSLRTVLEVFGKYDAQVGTEQERPIVRLLLILFKWMGKGDFGSTISQLVSTILDRYQPHEDEHSQPDGKDGPVWAAALRNAVRSRTIEVTTLRVHLLPVLFKRSSEDFAAFLWTIGLERLSSQQSDTGVDANATQDKDDELLYASLQAGRDLGLLQETDEPDIRQHDGVIFVPIRWFGRLLVRSSRTARLTGLSLLISSHAATRPFSPSSLIVVKQNLSHFLADTDTNFRSEVFSVMQRMVDRLRAVTAMLARHARQVDRPTNRELQHIVQPTEPLQYHQAFLGWLIRLLTWELRPTASYQRHISALKCLAIVARSGLDADVQDWYLSKSALGETRWPFHIRLKSRHLHRLLLDLLVDPFDDVRQTASTVLGLYPVQDSAGKQQTQLALSRAEEAMLATGRADQADGVAHLYALLYTQSGGQGSTEFQPGSPGSMVLMKLVDRLEEMLGIAKGDLAQAVERYPVHGLLTGIRYILGQNAFTAVENVDLFDRLAKCLEDVWEVAKPVLCSDAPEGYLPEGLEDEPNVTTKDTLSYCWRALKEASLLLGLLVSIKQSAQDGIKADERLQRLSDLCFAQLAELRHRGAFSTVAQTWIICSVQTAARQSDTAKGKLTAWYDKVMTILRNKTTINTRRSAGLPSLLCGILIADSSTLLMRQAFNDLESIARDPVAHAFAQEGSLPQVHAMNCMKDVLKNSRLGEQSERHVPAALELAADALRSDAWAVRNCGLMLFRAVIDRLLGTSDTYLEDDAYARKRLSIERHPQLLEIVLKLLAAPPSVLGGSASAGNEGVFPALQLLQRLAVPEERLSEIRRSVKALTASPAWHVRDKAARTYASFLANDQTAAELKVLLHTPTTCQNTLHGALLCAKYLIRGLMMPHPAIGVETGDEHSRHPQDVQLLAESLDIVAGTAGLYHENSCPFTSAAYIDLYTACLSALYGRHVPSPEPQVDGSHGLAKAFFDFDYLQKELRDSLPDKGQNKASAAFLRPTLAAASAAQLAATSVVEASQWDKVRSVVSELASRDPDACATYFDKTRYWLSIHSAAERLDHVNAVVQICIAVLKDQHAKVQVRSQTVATLLDAVDNLRLVDADSPSFYDFAVEPQFALEPSLRKTNQHYADLLLQLRAACLDCRVRHDGLTGRKLIYEVETWTVSCSVAVAGSGFYSCEAAALAIGRVSSLWPALPENNSTSKAFLRLCLTVYDLLNNDDEDIRVATSQATCKIIVTEGRRAEDNTLVPIVASQRLMSFMLRKWHGDPALSEEAFSRAFRSSEQTCPSLAEQLQVGTDTDTALFAEEKQNLYIDAAREVKAWCQVLLQLPPRSVSRVLLKRLCHWVINGLTSLIDKATAVPDGPVGWTTKSELFVLGLQVIYGAGLLLNYAEQGLRLPIKPSSLRRRLAELQDAGSDNGGINHLWREEIQSLLARSVILQLRSVHAVLGQLVTPSNSRLI